MTSLSLAAAMAGAVSFYVALQHLWLHIRRPKPSDLYFAIACLAMTSYCFSAALLYQAETVQEAAPWQRLQFVSVAALAMPMVLFVSEQGGLRIPRWMLLALCFFPVSAGIAAFERQGWLFSGEAHDKILRLGRSQWLIHEYAPGPLQKTLELTVPLLIAYFLWVGAGAPKRRGSAWFFQTSRSSPLVLASTALLLSVLHDIGVSRGLLHHPYLLEYTWVGVIVVMSWSTASEVSDAKQTRMTLEETERRVATTLAAIQDAVITCDLRGNVAHMNPAAERLLAVSLWDVLDRPLAQYMEITSPETHSVVRDPVHFAVGRPQNPYGTLPQLVTTDGNERRVDLTGAPLKDPRGRVEGAIIVMRDLTLQHNALSSLERAKQMESMGQLAGGAAHDLNNLLTPIISYVELVQRQMDKESRSYVFLSHVQEAAQRAAELTRQLLALSRKQVLDVHTLPLAEFLRQTRPMLEQMLGEDVELKLDIQDRQARVRIDPAQFEQVLLNLAGNARDAMTGSVRKLTISTRLVPDGDVALEVADTGIGMDDSTQERIFEPFFTTKPRGKGTGLGLASVRGIVEQLGGAIYVDSEPGRGTSFEIVLPVARGEEAQSSVRSLPPSDLARGNEHILVTEDDPAVRTLIFDALTQLGYTVHAADGLGMALSIIESEPVDMLLTDVVLPTADGPRIRDEILKHKDVPCLFMTGHADDRLGERGIVARGTEVLRKPFSVVQLGESVRRVLDSHRTRSTAPSA